jgi:hypothetical protein
LARVGAGAVVCVGPYATSDARADLTQSKVEFEGSHPCYAHFKWSEESSFKFNLFGVDQEVLHLSLKGFHLSLMNLGIYCCFGHMVPDTGSRTLIQQKKRAGWAFETLPRQGSGDGKSCLQDSYFMRKFNNLNLKK